MGCEHESDERVVPQLERRVDRAGDPRLPVAHAGEDADAHGILEGRSSLLGDRVERRRPVGVVDPESSIAGDEVLEELGPHGAAAADVGVVRGHIGQPVRRAVGHEDDGGSCHAATTTAVRSRTSSTSRVRWRGSVSGSTP